MSAGPAKSKIQGASNAGWMLTFADLLSLLLTFFVLVFSMSTIQFDNWKSVVTTMRDQFNPSAREIALQRFENDEPVARRAARGLNLNYLKALVERDLKASERFADAAIRRDNDRVVVSIPASRLFENKSGRFQPGAVSDIRRFAGSLVQLNNRLTVASHTNDLPVPDSRFRSNWELSVTRARLVAGVLVDAGYLQPITILGHADSKFAARDGRRVTVNELDAQERVDFVILAEGRSRGPFDVF